MKRPNFSYCTHNGYLVGGEYWIPDSMYDYLHSGEKNIIGCNQVYCAKCSQLVQQRAGFHLDTKMQETIPAIAKILFGNSAWDKLGFLVKDDSNIYKLYFCACFAHEEKHSTPLDGSSDHPIYGSDSPNDWKCHGHPTMKSPTDLFGKQLENLEDSHKIIDSILNHTFETQNRIPEDEVNPEAFILNRYYQILPDSPFKEKIDQYISTLGVHPTPLFRSVACKFIEKFPQSNAGSKLVEAYKLHPELFDGIKHPHYKSEALPYLKHKLVSLTFQFQTALLKYAENTGDPLARELIRKLILENKMETIWGKFSKSIGEEWINEHFLTIYQINPKANIFSLLQSQAEKDENEILNKLEQLKSLKLIPEKEMQAEIPYSVRKKIRSQP